jgi:magnesium-protoporphyrin O-methyltransferase
MTNCQCEGIEIEAGNWLDSNLKKYRAGKPAPTTAMLISALLGYDLADRVLLDIGGGIGAIQLELLRAGLRSATGVEASTDAVEVARREAARVGVSDRITAIHGNFVELAGEIPDADIVTLDRVICCYDDVQKLVSLSASKARWLYAVAYPVDSLWNRIEIVVENLWYWLRRNPFRAFVHPTRLVEEIIGRHGLVQVYRDTVFDWPNRWQVVVYERMAK